jgi:transcriptional regulator with XRE-family HTH domain
MPKTTNWRDLRADTITTPEQEASVAREREVLSLERRLFALRKQLGLSQATVAERLATTQANVSRIEKEADVKLSTLDSYIGGLGGRLEIRAVFPSPTEAADAAPRRDEVVVLWSGSPPANHDSRAANAATSN